MPEVTDERLTLALEQLHADERLTADLTDPVALDVYAWLEGELRAAQGLDDQQWSQRIADLRRAVLFAARDYADDAEALLAQARAQVASSTSSASEPEVATSSAPEPAKAASGVAEVMEQTGYTWAAQPTAYPQLRPGRRVRRRGWRPLGRRYG